MRFSIGFCAQMLGEYKGGGVNPAVNCNQLENEEESQARPVIYHILDKLCGEMCWAGNWKGETQTGKNRTRKKKVAGEGSPVHRVKDDMNLFNYWLIDWSGTEKTAGSAEQCRAQPAVSGRSADHHLRAGDQGGLTETETNNFLILQSLPQYHHYQYSNHRKCNSHHL